MRKLLLIFALSACAFAQTNIHVNNVKADGTLTVTGASTLSSVNTILYPTRGANAGSATGGIQEAITSLAGTQGIVFIDKNVTSTVAINMAADIWVTCAANTSITFTGATPGFVWPTTAHRSRVSGCKILAGNAGNTKAFDIEDAIAGAHDVYIQDNTIDSTNAPTTRWAVGFYCSNAILNHFERNKIYGVLQFVHTDGQCNATVLSGNNGTGTISGTTAVDYQGGSPIQSSNNEWEGNFSSELVNLTQPGATTYLISVNDSLENQNATGKGYHVNGATCAISNASVSIDGAATAIGIVIGDISTTHNCNVFNGQGTAWTLGASASGNSLISYFMTGSQVDNSAAGSNTYMLNRTSAGFTTSSFADVQNFTKGLNAGGGLGGIVGLTNFVDANDFATHGFLNIGTNNALPSLNFKANGGAVSLSLFNNGLWHFGTGEMVFDVGLDGIIGATTPAAGTFTTLTANTALQLTTGTISRHATFAGALGCTTAAAVGATCTSAALNWSSTLGDTSYFASCDFDGATTGVPVVVSITKTSATQFTATVAALTAVGATGSIVCNAWHN